MLIIIDKRLPIKVRQFLAKYGELIEFATSGITYEAISGHPDIFFCQTTAGLIVAPNTPGKYLSKLIAKKIPFTFGRLPVGNSYPESARYNAVVTDKYLIHNQAITDPSISALTTASDNLTFTLSALTLNQGYTRCNLIALGESNFITSDKGIEKALQAKCLEVQFVSPVGILLPGYENGFFGGCCGIWDDKLFITGNLDHYSEGERVREIAAGSGMEIIELYDGPLFDGGGIFFIPD